MYAELSRVGSVTISDASLATTFTALFGRLTESFSGQQGKDKKKTFLPAVQLHTLHELHNISEAVRPQSSCRVVLPIERLAAADAAAVTLEPVLNSSFSNARCLRCVGTLV